MLRTCFHKHKEEILDYTNGSEENDDGKDEGADGISQSPSGVLDDDSGKQNSDRLHQVSDDMDQCGADVNVLSVVRVPVGSSEVSVPVSSGSKLQNQRHDNVEEDSGCGSDQHCIRFHVKFVIHDSLNRQPDQNDSEHPENDNRRECSEDFSTRVSKRKTFGSRATGKANGND